LEKLVTEVVRRERKDERKRKGRKDIFCID